MSMDHSLLTCIKDTNCFLLLRCGKHFLDNRPLLVMKIRLYTAWNKHICHKAVPRWNKYLCLSPLGTHRKWEENLIQAHLLYHHICRCQLTLTTEAQDFLQFVLALLELVLIRDLWAGNMQIYKTALVLNYFHWKCYHFYLS